MERLTAGIVIVAWVVEAVALGYVMRRRGYDGYAWTVMALALGPIVLPIAVRSLRQPASESQLLRAGSRGPGPVDVLVGVDGSPESLAAVRAAASLFGDETGRVTLAAVVPVDATPEADAEAQRALADAASAGPGDPALVLLHGRPAPALAAYARRLNYEVLAIGTRGTSRSLLAGSVACELARGTADVPVLLVEG